MQVRKLSYLAIDRLGELLGLTADALSPIHDLQSAILGLKKAMPSELKEGLDANLLAQGLLTAEAEGLQPTASMKLFISALYCPKDSEAAATVAAEIIKDAINGTFQGKTH